MRNIVENHYWSYNPDWLISNSTSPLYLMCLSTASWLCRDVITGIVAVNAFCLWAIVILLIFLLRPLIGMNGALLMGGGFMLHRYVGFLIGLESLLFLACSMAAIAAYVSRRWRMTGLLLALTVLARPDGVLLACILAFAYLLEYRALPPWRAILVFLTPICGWYLLHYVHFGSALPISVAVKMAQGKWGEGLVFHQQLWDNFLACEPIPHRIANWIGLIAAVTGFAWATKNRFRPGILVGSFGLLHFLGYSVLRPYSYFWYHAPEFFTVWFLAPIGLSLVFKIPATLPNALSRMMGGVAMKVVMVVVMLFAIDALWVYSIFGKYRAPLSSDAHQAYLRVADQIRHHFKPGDRVMTAEIGGIGWCLPDQIVEDSVGLSGAETPEEVMRGDFGAWLRREDRLPDYVIVVDVLAPMIMGADRELLGKADSLYARLSGSSFAGLSGSDRYTGYLLKRKAK